jgi:uncharacterized protein YciI
MSRPAIFLAACLAAGASLAASGQAERSLFAVLLRKGPQWTGMASPALSAAEQDQSAYLARLVAAGDAAIAGPVDDNTDLRGLIVLRARDPDDATRMASEEPAIRSGRLTADVRPLLIRMGWFTFRPVEPDQPQHRFAIVLLSPTTTSDAGAGPEAPAPDASRVAFLAALKEHDQLVLDGSLGASGRELAVLSTGDVATARALIGQDPAVAAGLLAVEIHLWYAPDRVMTVIR